MRNHLQATGVDARIALRIEAKRHEIATFRNPETGGFPVSTSLKLQIVNQLKIAAL
jgi:hypothetical protein